MGSCDRRAKIQIVRIRFDIPQTFDSYFIFFDRAFTMYAIFGVDSGHAEFEKVFYHHAESTASEAEGTAHGAQHRVYTSIFQHAVVAVARSRGHGHGFC